MFIRGFPYPLFSFPISDISSLLISGLIVIVTPPGSAIKTDRILHQQGRGRLPFNLEESHAKSFKTTANIHLARHSKL
jgi:hypothetical protein